MKKSFGKRIISAAIGGVLVFSSTGGFAGDYTESMKTLQEFKIMVGYEDGKAHAEDFLTRAQAAATIMRLYGFDDAKWYRSDVPKFSDVPLSHWSSGYVYKAASENIIDGIDGNLFDPEEFVTYEQAVKMVICLLGMEDGLRYPDGYLQKAKELSLLDNVTGEKGKAISRGELSILICNALNLEQEEEDGSVTTLAEKRRAMVRGAERNTGVLAGDEVMMEAPEIMADFDISAGGGGGGSFAMKSSAVAAAPMTGDSPMVSGSFEFDAEGDSAPLPPDMQEQIKAGQLTAGQWKDTEHWDFWRKVMSNKEHAALQRQWEISADKYDVLVTDGGIPCRDCRVEVAASSGEIVWESKTDKDGRAFVFLNQGEADGQQSDFTVTVYSGDNSTVTEHVLFDPETLLQIECAQQETEDILDLMFTIDTTGSMGDELRYINEELKDVVSRIDSNVRVSCNYYRDEGDAYVVKPFDFSTNIDLVAEQISMQYASGGGDYEEAVDLALLNSIQEHDWSESARARLLFLVLDAPPHLTPEVVENLKSAVKEASEKGIRIIPVASSGVDKNTEFLMRTLAIATNGTYIFLTDHSGIGASHIEPTIGEYEVEFLNELILKVINEYLGE